MGLRDQGISTKQINKQSKKHNNAQLHKICEAYNNVSVEKVIHSIILYCLAGNQRRKKAKRKREGSMWITENQCCKKS